jgi:mannose-6-phosphate isomerase-like protein (cupin superfamily)
MQIFNAHNVGKFSDEGPAKDAEIDPNGYVRTGVISNDICSVAVAAFRDGQIREKNHWHPHAAEIYYVLEGEGIATDADGNQRRVATGDVVYFDAAESHNMHAAPGHDCKYYRVQVGGDRHAVDEDGAL